MSATAERLTAALADRYRIERELGQGGMATVYLAEDLKHHRQVAIKVLKSELAAVLGAERFVQEIATTAHLQHPNILPLFDSGEADGFLYYVMPYVEGETLRDKLNRETQLGVDEAVKITTEVADALQYAHEHGVVHRDIKPGNILLHAGRPMVADFGIALAVSAAAGTRVTETGLSLGTPTYMSPEQATAEKAITNRSDVYSLATVLYEMLAGQPPHLGATAQQIILKIIAEPVPPVASRRKSVPPNVSAAIARALEKLPADRFESAKAFVVALETPAFRRGTAAEVGAPEIERWKRLSIGLAAAGVLLGVAVIGLILRPRSVDHNATEIRFTIPVGPDTGVYLGGGVDATFGRPATTALALSPDGNLLVYAGWKAAPRGKVTSQLYRRPLGQEHASAIPGTEGASTPFFSPDGAWIAYFAGPSLRRVSVTGDKVVTIAAHALEGADSIPFGASWSDDGTIVYGGLRGIYAVSARGGEPRLLAAAPRISRGPLADSSAVAKYREPQILPGGRALIFSRMEGVDAERSTIVALDLASRTQTTLLADAMDPRYVAPGHLLLMRRGTLMEVGFDPRHIRILGQPRAVRDDVMQALFMPNSYVETGGAQVAVSRSGNLAYVRGGTFPELPLAIVHVLQNGEATRLDWDPHGYLRVRASPRGDRVAYSAGPGNMGTIYVRDLTSGTTLQLNTGGLANTTLEWSPDGKSIAFTSVRDGAVANVYRMPSDGSGVPERLAPANHMQHVASWSSTGVIAFLQANAGQFDIWTVAPGEKPVPFVASSANEMFATFSPDGRWLAYASDQTGRNEVYVRPYPGPGAAVPISGGGGESPVWSPDGRRFYYLEPGPGKSQAMMVVDVQPGEPFRVGRASTLIDAWPYITASPVRSHDMLRDGSFIVTDLMLPATGRAPGGHSALRYLFRVREIHVVLHFFSELDGKTP